MSKSKKTFLRGGKLQSSASDHTVSPQTPDRSWTLQVLQKCDFCSSSQVVILLFLLISHPVVRQFSSSNTLQPCKVNSSLTVCAAECPPFWDWLLWQLENGFIVVFLHVEAVRHLPRSGGRWRDNVHSAQYVAGPERAGEAHGCTGWPKGTRHTEIHTHSQC